MRFKNFSRSLVWMLTLSFIALSSCHTKDKVKQKKADNSFTTYINGFTSGLISNSDPVIIELASEQKVKAGDKVADGIFEFTPEIKGTATWKDTQTIQFTPDERLPNGTHYDVVFHLGKVMEAPKKFQNFKFELQTKTQAIDVTTQGMSPYDVKKLQWNKIEGSITTADYADNFEVEKVLAATQKGKEKKITWTHDAENKQHSFVIDSVYRGDKKSKLIVQWNGKPIGAKEKNEKVINIPSINTFELMSYETKNEPEQVVILYFSDPIRAKQNIKGLIRFQDKTRLRYSISDATLKVYPKSRIKKPTQLIVSKNIRNSMGRKMQNTLYLKVEFTSLKPDIKSLSKGVIMPDSKGLIFPFKAVNVKAVNVKIIKIFENNVPQFLQVNQLKGNREITRVGRIVYKDEVKLTNKAVDLGVWNTFALDLSDMISVDPGAIYRVIISFNKKQSLYECSGNSDDDSDVVSTPRERDYDGPSDDYYYYEDEYYYYDYDYKERDNPCSNSYYYGSQHSIKQNILASNFGIIAKEDADHNLNVFITDLVSLDKLSGVKINIYNYQHQLIGSATTNSEGRAIMDVKSKAFLLVAEKDSKYGYLRLDNGSSLSLSMFNVGGKKIQKGVKGYLFADRGVWRPGDSIYMNFILEDKGQSLPDHHPVVMEIYNPQNQLFKRITKTQSVQNFYDFRWATSPDAITGNWVAKAKVGGATFTKTIKVEAIKPNRLKINLEFPDKILHSNDKAFTLTSKWLHGTPAAHMKAIVEMQLKNGKTGFKNYPDFHFDDPSKSLNTEEEEIFVGKLDAEGKATVPLNFNLDKAPGMLKANFKTRVFENSGNFSIDRYSKVYSPYESYVGVKVPKGKGWNNALYSDEPNLIPIVTVDEYGKPVNRKKLKVEVYSISWRWWWQRNRNEDLGYYLQSSNATKILTDYVSTRNGKAMYELRFPEETWGRKFIKITDPVSGHSTGQVFYTDYKGWWDNPDNKIQGGAEMLSFSTDKRTYGIGEQVKMRLPVSSKGKALISIENGTRVLDAFWTDVSKSDNQVTFTTTKEMTPNVYIHISYIQPHSQSENDRPIRLYGVQGINVEDAGSHLHPVIDMPDELRPEKKVTVKIKEKDGKKMTYSLFVVDEGLLDLTRFKTPNPWNTFYAHEALGVKSYDMYNDVMGAFSGKIAGLLAIGGDEDLIETGNKKANRFKPVVKFIGTFELGKGKTAKHTFMMPNYIGSVRTMVVAGDLSGAYGAAEKATPVKKPLMVLGTLPRVLGPQEQVKLPVTVFAMDKKIKNVKVRVKTNDLLSIKGSKTQTIHFDKEGEKMLFFDMEVARKVGVAKVDIEVSGSGEKATYPIELQVRIANPEWTKTYESAITAGKSWQQTYVPVGIIGTNKAVLEVSSFPPINLASRLDYLIQYPHGCIEQTTSSVFPQLYLSDLMELSQVRKAEIQDNITQALERLKRFQLTNGGFTYWPGSDGYASDWGTNYAGHFLLEAKRKGYKLPVGMLEDWIKFQRNRANDWSSNKSNNHSYNYYVRSSQLTQAYRLYTLALAGKPALGAMNRLKETSNLHPTAAWRLLTAYYLAGKKSIAREMMKNLPYTFKDYKEYGYSYGSAPRDVAMVLETLVTMKDYTKAKRIFDIVTKNLASSQWMSTQTTSYSLLAVSKFVGKQSKKPMIFKLTTPNGSKKYESNSPIMQIPLSYKKSGTSEIQLVNKGDKMLFTRLINKGIPLESNDLKSSSNLEMEIIYADKQGSIIDPKTIRQGTDFVIKVNIRHPGILPDYKNIALTQIFPSGWEISNARMDQQETWKSDTFDYQDIRDDRVMTYFDLKKGQTKTFYYLGNATYAGDYYLPGVKCEAMYDNSVTAYTNGMWVKVVK